MIRVSIYDDNDSLRDTIALLLNLTDDIITMGAYADVMDVVATVQHDKPDVVLMDIDMPGRTGIEALRLLDAAGCLPRVLMLTFHEDTDRIFDAIASGAVGYLLKKAPAPQILSAIRDVAEGGAAMTPSIARKVIDAFQQPRPFATLLTDKERQVLQCLVGGDSYKMIADHCGISMGTVRSHIVNIYQKLHVNSKSEAVAKAMKAGFSR